MHVVNGNQRLLNPAGTCRGSTKGHGRTLYIGAFRLRSPTALDFHLDRKPSRQSDLNYTLFTCTGMSQASSSNHNMSESGPPRPFTTDTAVSSHEPEDPISRFLSYDPTQV